MHQPVPGSKGYGVLESSDILGEELTLDSRFTTHKISGLSSFRKNPFAIAKISNCHTYIPTYLLLIPTSGSFWRVSRLDHKMFQLDSTVVCFAELKVDVVVAVRSIWVNSLKNSFLVLFYKP